MTLALVSWLLFAPLFLILRRALLATGTPPAEGAPGTLRTPAQLAAGLDVSLRVVDNACSHAELARHTGEASSTRLMLSCVRQSTGAFVSGLSRDVAGWGAATSESWLAPDVAPPPAERLRSPLLRALAWSDRAGRAALPATVARLRLRLFLLRGMLSVVRWESAKLRMPRWRRTWNTLSALRADLPLVAEQVRQSHGVVIHTARANGDVH